MKFILLRFRFQGSATRAARFHRSRSETDLIVLFNDFCAIAEVASPPIILATFSLLTGAAFSIILIAVLPVSSLVILMMITPIFSLCRPSSRFSIADNVFLIIIIMSVIMFALRVGFLFVLRSGSLAIVLSQGVCGGKFFGIHQLAVLRSEEISVGIAVVGAAETTYGIAISIGCLMTNLFRLLLLFLFYYNWLNIISLIYSFTHHYLDTFSVVHGSDSILVRSDFDRLVW